MRLVVKGGGHSYQGNSNAADSLLIWTHHMDEITFKQRRRRAPVFAALGDETRLSLLTKLGDRQPHSISQLTHGSRLTPQAITKQLRVLQRAGIVRGSRAGRASRFILDPRPIDDLQHYLDSFPPNGTKPSPA